MRKISFILSLFLVISLIFSSSAFAHVIVSPSQVGVAKTQDFTINVPNEKDNPIVAIKLLIPNGVSNIVPNTTPGWTIATQTRGENNIISEIDWTDGSISAGQRQEFVFEAQAPATATTLPWKAYQTYSDGTVVSWDIDPKTLAKLSDEQQDALAEKENKGEYSTTTVINDLAIPQNATVTQVQQVEQKATTALVFSIIAIAIACVSLSIARRKTEQKSFPITSAKLKPSRSRKRSR
jgi:uncharacterized protein YcnI